MRRKVSKSLALFLGIVMLIGIIPAMTVTADSPPVWTFTIENAALQTVNINDLPALEMTVLLENGTDVTSATYRWFARLTGAANITGVPLSQPVAIDLEKAKDDGFVASLQLVDELGLLPKVPGNGSNNATVATGAFNSETWQYFLEVSYVVGGVNESVRSAVGNNSGIYIQLFVRWEGPGIVQNKPIRDYFPWVHDPDFYDLMPHEPYLNDPFTFFAPVGQTSDLGTDGKVKTEADWWERDAELRDMFAYYLYGFIQPTPKENITVNTATIPRGSATGANVGVTIRDNGRVWTGNIMTGVRLPSDAQVAASEFNWEDGIPLIFGAPAGMTDRLLANGIAIGSFASGIGTYNGLYPRVNNITEFNTGSFAAGAWALGRVIDAVEMNPQWGINPYAITTVGVSIGGKQSLHHSALEPRVGLVLTVESGAVGLANFRYNEEGFINRYHVSAWDRPVNRFERLNNVGRMNYATATPTFDGNNSAVFAQGTVGMFSQNGGTRQARTDSLYYLPLDQHLIVALAAGRGFLGFTGSEDNDGWYGSHAQLMSVEAAREVFEFLGNGGSIGFQMRDNAHAVQQRDVPFMIGAFNYLFGESGKATVPAMTTAATPSAYGTGVVYENIAAMTWYPYEINNEYVQWARPTAYSLWTDTMVVTEGFPATVLANTNAPNGTVVSLDIWTSGDMNPRITPTNLGSFKATVKDGQATFNLGANDVVVGRYQLSIAKGEEVKSIFFSGLDIHTALRTGATRHTVDNFVMYSMGSRVNHDTLRVHTVRNGIETDALNWTTDEGVSGVFFNEFPAWYFPYGASARIPGSTRVANVYDAFIMRGLQMEGMPGYTFELSMASAFISDHGWSGYVPTPVSWPASDATRNIGPYPHWPPEGALFSAGGTQSTTAANAPAGAFVGAYTGRGFPWREEHFPVDPMTGERPLTPQATIPNGGRVLGPNLAEHNFQVELTHSYVGDGYFGGVVTEWTIDFSEPVNRLDFGIGFNFSDDFTLIWNEDATQLKVEFHSCNTRGIDSLGMYIFRMRDMDQSVRHVGRSSMGTPTFFWVVTGNQITAPVYHSFELVQSDADFLLERKADILKNGFSVNNLILSANNNATLTLVIDGRIFVLATKVNNRNVSGTIELPDGSGTLVFDIKGNGSNVKIFNIIPTVK